ncbi:MAG: HAD family hydrolase [Elusimicrobiaceae bacterium]|nr:HAD family hydrolase [Elusimicrobiaceae bacterium]
MKLAIFDLDGTLLDTIADLEGGCNTALTAMGFEKLKEGECVTYVGNGVVKLLERSLPLSHRSPENVARARKIFFEYYDSHLWDYTRPYPGICEMLKTFQERGVLLAVASNKYQSATERLVKHFFPEIKFVSVLGQREGVPIKPDPTIVEEILNSAQVAKEDALYVGDSDVDMMTAQRAGVRSCGVTWGFKSREVLASYQPTFLADKTSDILEII